MATNVGELEATLRLRDELSARLKDVDANLAKSGQSFEAVGAKAKGFGSMTDGLVGTLTKVGAAFGVAFSAQAVVGAITNLGKLGSELTDLSMRTGISVVELQRLGAVAEANGSSMEELGNAVQGMARKLAGGNDAAAKAVRMLGLEIDDLVAMSPDQAFLAIADAAAAIHNPMERTALLTELGGKAFEKLSPTIANVREELEGMTTYMDAETVAALDTFDDKLTEFGRAWDVFLARFALPVVQEATAGLDWLIAKFADLRAAQADAGDQDAIAALSAGPAAFAAYTAAVQDTAGSFDVFGAAADALAPKVEATTDGFNRAAETLRLLREDAVYPLTDAEKNLIIQLDAMGVSLSEMADAIDAPDLAVKGYLKSVDDAAKAHQAFGESSDALGNSLDALALHYQKLEQAAIAAQTAQTNQATVDQFMATGDTLGSSGEFKALPADQLGQIDAIAQGYANLEAHLEQIRVTGVNVAAESAAAWATYNAEVIRLQGGMTDAITATDGMTASTGRLHGNFVRLQQAMSLPVPKDWDWTETYKDSPLYKGYDISGGWAVRGQMEQERQKAITTSAMSGPWGAAPGSPINVNVNATNSLILPSNQQSLGQIVSQAVIAQLKAQGVKVGSA